MATPKELENRDYLGLPWWELQTKLDAREAERNALQPDPGVVARESSDVYSPKTRTLTSQLSQLVRAIGDERITPNTDETRLTKAIRAMYRQAGRGDSSAAKVIFDRGWGNVPNINVDATKMTKDVLPNVLRDLGLTVEEAAQDELVLKLFEAAGINLKPRLEE